MIRTNLITTAIWILAFAGCSAKTEMVVNSDMELNELVFFGHQSVGDNILTGIEELDIEGLPIFKLDQPQNATSGLAHSGIGENRRPDTKLHDFQDILINWPSSEEPDIALMKFCYLDIHQGTDVERLFEEYRETMKEIESRSPSVHLLHMTVPLTIRDGAVKVMAKRILGRTLFGFADNVSREKYNNLMREAYENEGTLFDIARLESTKPDGTRDIFVHEGVEAHSLFRGYASDNGHLNENGRTYIAREFLSFLKNNTQN